MRWIKLLRDVGAESGRSLIMLAAVAFALFAVATMLGAFGIVTREVRTNYMTTTPAHATIDVDAVTPEILATARAFPGIADAEGRSVFVARVKAGDDWMKMLLFVAEDNQPLRLNRFAINSGSWPPPRGSMLVERLAAPIIGARPGGTVTVKAPDGEPTSIAVTGIVHDTTLAPAWQEQTGYGYITRSTLADLGEPPVLEELRILLAGNPTRDEIDAKTLALADALKAEGVTVHEIKVPPPGEHPHQGQITSALLMFLSFAVLALILAAILVAAVLAASLARQTREIGVMKAVGARSSQIAVMYVGMLLALGALSVAISLPLGFWAAGQLAVALADTMNFTVTDFAVPLWVYAVVIAAGFLMPLLAALWPIVKASRTTVREAIASSGLAAGFGGGGFDRALSAFRGIGLPYVLAARNAFRRRGRLILALAMLAAGGGVFVAALSVRDGWRDVAGAVLTDRHYDLELTFANIAPRAPIAAALDPLTTISRYEIWGYEQTAFSNAGKVDVMRTYPDGGHGSFAVFGVPPGTTLVSFPPLVGRWLKPDDTNAVVISQTSLRQHPELKLGDTVHLSIAGRSTDWTLVGAIREIGGGGAYVPKAAYDALVGTDGGGRLVRVALNDADRTPANIAAVAAALDQTGLPVERSAPLDTLYVALVGHVEVPIRMLVAAAILLALIGGLGLASMMTVNVLERTRELGVMKAIGAQPPMIVKIVLGEGIVVAALSWIAALVVAVPIILGVDQLAASMFGSPLPFTLSLTGIVLWLGLIVAIAAAATILPALRASRLIVREALAYT